MKKLTGSFRYTQWDPWLIISQITCIQCILYTTLGWLLFILGSLVGETRNLDHIFEYHEIQVRDAGGRIVIMAFVLNALIGLPMGQSLFFLLVLVELHKKQKQNRLFVNRAFSNVIMIAFSYHIVFYLYKQLIIINSVCFRAVILWFVVERTKQCLDFSCTWYFFHLIVCWFYNGNFPTTFSWWTLNIACVSVMCVCGEFLCLKSELQAIPLSLGPKTDL
ncbi:sys1 [Holotrichia oblita]|uniref:Sys1 n=1 Tax=Holotrichia oblita TaxID=644536 RepID=A0ACB9TNB7_HOLOL|nr:sys1 [Holotrichia oblita]